MPSQRTRHLAFTLAVGLLIPPGARAQVNIEQHRPGAPGTALTVDASVSLRSGNSDLFDVSGGARLVHQHDKRTWLALARVRYGENNGREYANSSFGHLRFTRWLSPTLAAETFTQLERDDFTLLQLRFLAGAGGRVRIAQDEHLSFFYGSALMLELENLDESRVVDHPAATESVRWSNYVSFRWDITPRSSLSSTAYVQPRVNNFDDVRVLHDGALEAGITDTVSIRMVIRQRFDNGPPDNLEKYDLVLENGIRLRL